MDKFIRQAVESGFSEAQAKFMKDHMAPRPHTHIASEIIVDEAANGRLDEVLEVYDEQIEALEEGCGDDDDDDEEDGD